MGGLGWVGLGEEKWTHVHLCADINDNVYTTTDGVLLRSVEKASVPLSNYKVGTQSDKTQSRTQSIKLK